jgi:hypothetical protein
MTMLRCSLEQRVPYHVFDALAVAASEPPHRVRDTLGGLDQPLTIRILAEERELPPDERGVFHTHRCRIEVPSIVRAGLGQASTVQ